MSKKLVTKKTLEQAQKSVDKQAKKIKDDPTRPRYHALAPAYWMNDPNGPLLYKDEIHLFYQHYPFGPRWDTMHWGHMKTKDLIHWDDLPIAFGPSFERGENHCYSGCCIIGPDGRATALYTSIGDRMPEHWIAIGSENMLTWEKFEGNPVMDMEIHAESGIMLNDWRDPYAWKGEDGMYYCVIGGHMVDAQYPDPEGRNPTTFLYQSHDLKNWEFLNPLTSKYIEGKEVPVGEGVNVGRNWECPNFFKLTDSGDKWLLMISPHGPVPYSVGEYKDNQFYPKKWYNFDHSGVFYAPNSLIDQQGRNIVIGWIRMDFYDTWNGCFTLPRVVHLNDDNETITALPIPEISQLRGPYAKCGNFPIAAWDNQRLFNIEELVSVKDYIGEKSIEVLVKIKDRSNFYCQLFDSNEMIIDGTFGYDVEDKRFYIGKNSGVFELKEDEKLIEIRLFIDRSVIEIFINNRWAITQALKILPSNKLVFDFFAEERDLIIESLEVWGMNAK